MLGNQIVAGNLLVDYSYINAGLTNTSILIARCLTGLGSNDSDDNNALGGLYFNGNKIPNEECTDSKVQPNGAPIDSFVGVINIFQCGVFSTTGEGVYTCVIMNSSMMHQSARLGVYFTGRSELVDNIYPINSYLHLCTQLFH